MSIKKKMFLFGRLHKSLKTNYLCFKLREQDCIRAKREHENATSQKFLVPMAKIKNAEGELNNFLSILTCISQSEQPVCFLKITKENAACNN